MLRPTKQEVDAALEKADAHGYNAGKHHRLLAAEVRALRREVEQQVGAYLDVEKLRKELVQHESELAQLRAHDERRQKALDAVVLQLARLHALLSRAFQEGDKRLHVDQIRAALRGEP